jgi:hypothetical protein
MISLEQELPLRERIIDAKTRWESSYLTLAKYLYEVHRDRAWEDWGYTSLSDYCEKELDFHYRRAMFMIDIYGTAMMFNVPLDRLDKIGWAKAREIVRVMLINTVDEWLSEAERSTLKELVEKIKTAKQLDSENPVPPSMSVKNEKTPADIAEQEAMRKKHGASLIFKTEGFEYDIISGALDEAKTVLKTTNPTFALSVICMEWKRQREESGEQSDSWTLKEWMKYLADRFGVKLVKVVQEPKAPEPVEDTEEKLLEDEEDLGDLDELD